MRHSPSSSNVAVLSLGVYLWLLPHCTSQWTPRPDSDTKYMCTHVSLIPVTVRTGHRLSASAISEGAVLAAATTYGMPRRRTTRTDRRRLASHLQPTRLSRGRRAAVRRLEQGVDELLQLKFLQAVANEDDAPPAGSTIVLATGDGNVGQFNEEGFRGCVRTALKKGWRVELYAWEGGLSRTWVREFAEGPWSSRFRIIPIDGFGADLLDG